MARLTDLELMRSLAHHAGYKWALEDTWYGGGSEEAFWERGNLKELTQVWSYEANGIRSYFESLPDWIGDVNASLRLCQIIACKMEWTLEFEFLNAIKVNDPTVMVRFMDGADEIARASDTSNARALALLVLETVQTVGKYYLPDSLL